MDQTRSKKCDSRDMLPPLGGLILIGVLFIPGIRDSLGSWFIWTIGLLCIAVVGLIVRSLWRRRSAREEQEAPTLLPIHIPNDEERELFRAMCGVREVPRPPIKSVTPQIDDPLPTNDSPPNR